MTDIDLVIARGLRMKRNKSPQHKSIQKNCMVKEYSLIRRKSYIYIHITCVRVIYLSVSMKTFMTVCLFAKFVAIERDFFDSVQKPQQIRHENARKIKTVWIHI